MFYFFFFFFFHLLLLLLSPLSLPTANAKSTHPPPVSPSPHKVLFVMQIYANTEVNHMLDIADRLRARGHTCDFFMVNSLRPKVQARGFSFEGFSLDSLGNDRLVQLATDMSRTMDVPSYIKAFAKLPVLVAESYEPSLLALKRRLDRNGGRDRPDVIYASIFTKFAIDLAVHYDIALAVNYAGPLGALFGFEDTPAAPDSFLWQSRHNHHHLVQRLSKVFNLARAIYTTIPASRVINGVRRKYGLPQYYDPNTNLRRAAVIVSWPFGIDIARSIRPLTFIVGFMSEPFDPTETKTDQDHQIQAYLDSKPAGVLYCSLGSLAVPKYDDFQQITKAFELWIQQDSQNRGAIITMNQFAKAAFNISNFPPSILVHNWVNQKLILNHPHVSVYITHAGQGSIAEGLMSRTPMLAIPQFGDQMTNAYRIEEAGIALKLHYREDTISAENVLAKLIRLHTEPSFRSALDRHYQINHRFGGADKAAHVVEDLMMFGHLQHLVPITEKVPLHVRYNLDLMAVGVALGVLILYVVVKLAIAFSGQLFSIRLPAKRGYTMLYWPESK